MKKATVIINIPTIKHISDNLRIPIPTPDTVDIVAIAVIHQILTTYNNIFIFRLYCMLVVSGIIKLTDMIRTSRFDDVPESMYCHLECQNLSYEDQHLVALYLSLNSCRLQTMLSLLTPHQSSHPSIQRYGRPLMDKNKISLSLVDSHDMPSTPGVIRPSYIQSNRVCLYNIEPNNEYQVF